MQIRTKIKSDGKYTTFKVVDNNLEESYIEFSKEKFCLGGNAFTIAREMVEFAFQGRVESDFGLPTCSGIYYYTENDHIDIGGPRADKTVTFKIEQNKNNIEVEWNGQPSEDWDIFKKAVERYSNMKALW